MTYCFAWKYQDAVFLIADTLVTQDVAAPADHFTTSTGEPYRQIGKNEFVHERQLKFRPLKAGVAIAMAGDVSLGLAISDFMEDQIASVSFAADLLPTVEASFGPFDEKRGVELLIVQGTADGRTTITKWNTHGLRHEADYCAHIGSMPVEEAERIANLFQRLVADRRPSKRAMMLAGIAFVQSLCKHNDLIEQHVGGVVCGLRVQCGRTIWPGDIVIVHHRDEMASVDGRISLHAREGIVLINSTYHGRIGTIFVNKNSRIRTDVLQRSWTKSWLPYLQDYLSKHFINCERWLFINLDRQTPVVFVAHGRLRQASNQLRVTRKPQGQHDFNFGLDLADLLKRPAPSEGPDLRILEVVDHKKPLPEGMSLEQAAGN